ncbi:hypothetical protein NLJ89_g12117 [Agrocybe chaxingu]|uniref:Uncharacterized protein n=1 Tax=Agrocybe chaxingu TaxID=84603 RepID=A0A9W8MNS8_9AGAR|nr:hypothetical protein NLJ89_g12117 [Agrocybe chaxingu]
MSSCATSFGAAAREAQPNYETISLVCAAYMNHLFSSARYPYPCPRSAWQSHLPSYIKRPPPSPPDSTSPSSTTP